MIHVLTWKWGSLFSPLYVNRLRLALERHLHMPHVLHCVTDDPHGLHPHIDVHPITEFTDTPRCRRRMKQYDALFAGSIGSRILSIDLDVVIVDDITPIVDRPEPIVCWKVGYAQVFSGSFVLYDYDALDGLYRLYAGDPIGFPTRVQPRGVPSDQAMLNYYLMGPVPHWTDLDGFVTYFGDGYSKFERLGVGPGHPTLPPGARIVVLGSADKAVMDEGRYEWVRENWCSLRSESTV